MRFNSGGKFKIMQITDIQEIPDVSPDTIKLINAALEEEKPDLVVLTGDQIKGYGVSYKGKGDALIESVAETVGKLLKPVTDRHIPFAVTFGNHDRQVGISNKDQFEKIYKALPGCVGEQAEGIDGGEHIIYRSCPPTANVLRLISIFSTAELTQRAADTSRLTRR